MTLTHPSPNFGDRRGRRVELVVLHYTVLDAAEALARLCEPSAQVSAHYLIDRDGTTLSLVDEAMRAWHAGAGAWGGEGDVNSRSIGIELVNAGDEPFPDPQMRALETLLAAILVRHGLTPRAVIGHSDMAPDRKVDPGPRFDWRRLALQGLSVWPQAVVGSAHPPSRREGGARSGAADFLAALRAFGYPQAAPETLLSAFRLRFRPWSRGPLDDTDKALIVDLAGPRSATSSGRGL